MLEEEIYKDVRTETVEVPSTADTQGSSSCSSEETILLPLPVSKKRGRPRKTESTPKPEKDDDNKKKTYCLCGQVAYGRMICCDNDLCTLKWYHFPCMSLTRNPKGKWYCPHCRGKSPTNPCDTILEKRSVDLVEVVPVSDENELESGEASLLNLSTAIKDIRARHTSISNASSEQIIPFSLKTTLDFKSQTMDWLHENVLPGGTLCKDFLRQKYCNFADSMQCTVLNAACFGKIMMECFPDAKTSKLRTGINSKSTSHYVGLHFKSIDEIPTLIENIKFDAILAKLKSQIPTLRHCPKGARTQAANLLNNIITNCVSHNTLESWQRLLSFSYACFPANKSSNDISNLTSKVKNNIMSLESINDQNYLPFLQNLAIRRPTPNKKQNKDSSANKSKKILSKLSDGDIKGAVRLLSSDEALAPQNDNTFKLLEDKHPAPSTTEIPQLPDPQLFLQITSEKVKLALFSFPNGSAGGIDGLHPKF